jgi:DNA-binding Lrp family transcriptional regulator
MTTTPSSFLLTAAETKLLALLRADARASVAALARTLGVARATVQERITRLEQKGVIDGYTVRVNPAFAASRLTAHSLLRVSPKLSDSVNIALKKIPQAAGVYALSGEFDLLVVWHADTTAELDVALDASGKIDGVERTQTSIVLSVKFER